jgi:hypothetical protein
MSPKIQCDIKNNFLYILYTIVNKIGERELKKIITNHCFLLFINIIIYYTNLRKTVFVNESVFRFSQLCVVSAARSVWKMTCLHFSVII